MTGFLTRYKKFIQTAWASFKREQGNSLVELVMVMLLLTLIGVTIFTLIFAGGDAEQKLLDRKGAQTDARIAMSYINVRLRQNDSAGKIQVRENPNDGNNAIVIQFREDDYQCDGWIFVADDVDNDGNPVKNLYECFIDPSMKPDKDFGFLIASVEDFIVEYDTQRNVVAYSVVYQYGDELKSVTNYLKLRSDNKVAAAD